MQADAAVGRRDDVAALGPPGLDHPVDRARIELGPVGEDDDAPPRRSAGSAASPQRSDAPGPRSQSGQWTLSTSSGCAPLTTTTPSTLRSARSASSTRGSSSTCFGGEEP